MEIVFQIFFMKTIIAVVVFGLTALSDSNSVYIRLFPRERDKEKRCDYKTREKKFKQPPPAPTARKMSLGNVFWALILLLSLLLSK